MISKTTIRRFTLAAALMVPAALFPAAKAHAGVFIGVSVGFAPPPLPIYVQPPLPSPGYLWTPGYWAYGDAGYYWTPGVWVQPPSVGLLWTPPYWGFEGGAYGFHGGYWGPHVGFYGGVNYGFGYGGIGFAGGEWRGGGFFYNGAVANFGGAHVTNVYVNRTVIQQNTIINNNHVAYNGGPGGINHAANADEQRFGNEQHVQPTSNQMQHQQLAGRDRSQLASVNHGAPGTTAAANNGAYRQTAQQHASSQPISSADRTAGQAYHPNAREANQDQRIANGERSGQVTSGEAARATANQSRIDGQVSADRAANGGQLTGQQHQQIDREQNNASRQISNDSHNANNIAPNEVNQREANQQQRTAQGLRSGQETSAEAARTNANQSAADQQVHNERTANGGALTQQQRQQANQQENRNSNQIANQKHNAAARTPPPPKANAAPRENEHKR